MASEWWRQAVQPLTRQLENRPEAYVCLHFMLCVVSVALLSVERKDGDCIPRMLSSWTKIFMYITILILIDT